MVPMEIKHHHYLMSNGNQTQINISNIINTYGPPTDTLYNFCLLHRNSSSRWWLWCIFISYYIFLSFGILFKRRVGKGVSLSNVIQQNSRSVLICNNLWWINSNLYSYTQQTNSIDGNLSIVTVSCRVQSSVDSLYIIYHSSHSHHTQHQ